MVSPQGLHVDVLRAESARDGMSPAVRRALVDQQPNLRVAALRALARIEETGTTGLVTPLLGDPDPDVAKWSAFAAGQIGDPAAEAGLRQAIPTLSAAPVQVIRALGRAGSATAARDLSRLLADERDDVRAAAALAMGLIAKRLGDEVPAAQYTDALAELAQDPDAQVRYGAVYALMRMPGPGAATGLASALGDEDPETRANAARGLGASSAAVNNLDTVLSDTDWRVRVEAVRALASLGAAADKDASQAVQRLVAMAAREIDKFRAGNPIAAGRSTHVLLEIINAAIAIPSGGERVLARLEEAGWSTPGRFADTVQGDVARVHCALAFAADVRGKTVRRVRTCGNATLLAWRRAELETRVLSRVGEDGVEPLLRFTVHKDPRVRAAAVTALGEIGGERVASVATALLSAADPYVVAGAAGLLADRTLAGFRPNGLVDRLGEALDKMVPLKDGNFAVALLDAVAALQGDAKRLVARLQGLGDDPRPAIRRRAALALEAVTGARTVYGPTNGPPAYSRPNPVGGRPRVRIQTDRGVVVAELYGDLAPRTVGTFTSLATSGFYDGKTFHRVVANFVAQGGCPRGDGWGGPGYTIEEETSPVPFVRGALGIATNGRDTGGSQFFFMHSYHPHLDGGYTVFGRVIEGIEVVDALQADDRIVSISVERAPGPTKGVK